MRPPTRSPSCAARASAAAGGTPVLLGGEVAEAYDTREALERDTRLIVPIGLGLILLILVVLLRAIVMPLYVIATVILSFGFALGVSSLVFTHVMDQPGERPDPRAVRVHLPGRARGRLQRLPARAHPRGARRSTRHQGRP